MYLRILLLSLVATVVIPACVTADSLRSLAKGVLDANGTITESISELDALCQARGKTPEELKACQAPRDKARAALRRQAMEFQRVAK